MALSGRPYAILPPSGRPYPIGADDDNAVEVIRHNDEWAQLEVGEPLPQPLPFPLDNPSGCVQQHLAIHDFTKKAGALLCDDGHEIRPCLGIIVFIQTDRTPVVFLWIVFHIAFSLPIATS